MGLKNKMKARDTKSSPVMTVCASLLLMFILSGLLLLLLAALLYKVELSESAVRIGIIVIYILSGAAGGFLAGKIQKEKKFLWGLIAGVLYFLILFLISAAVKGGLDMELTKLMTTFVLCAAAGMVGGMIS